MSGPEVGSYIWRVRIILSASLSPTEKIVLISIADYCSKGVVGSTWMSMKLIAAEAGITGRSVRRAFDSLADRGALSKSSGKHGRKIITVKWEALKPDTVSNCDEAKPDIVSSPPDTVSSPPDTVSAPIRNTQETPKKHPRKTQASATFDFKLGKGVAAAKVSAAVASVFSAWQSLQSDPNRCKLTKPRLGLLAAALADYDSDEIVSVIRLAYEAPVSDVGLPERFARAWRGDSGKEAPGLEMLLRRDKIARNVEMASRWSSIDSRKPQKAAPHVAPVATAAEVAWAEVAASATGTKGRREHLWRGQLSGCPDRSAALWRCVEAMGGWDWLVAAVERGVGMPAGWSGRWELAA